MSIDFLNGFRQLSMNVAHDEELLELLADANFGSLFIGIESINEESLKEANKLQNTRGDLVGDCIKIQSYGLLIKAGMIVGFDHDDERIFERQFDFLQQAHIPTANFNPLVAPIGTKLWRRLLREKRIIRTDAYEAHLNNPIILSLLTNIIPKKLTRVELIYQTAKLMERLHAWDNFMPRIQGYISGIKRKPRVAKGKIKFSIKTLYQTIRAISAVDKETRRSVFKIISYTKKHAPYLMSRVISATLVNYMRYYISRSTREDLENVIRIEKGLDINKYIDHSQVVVPKNFEDSLINCMASHRTLQPSS